MTTSSKILVALVMLVANVASATACPEAWVNCRTVVDEHDYRLAGGKLIETKPADLKNFPKGFLGVNCQGATVLSGVVQEDGSVVLAGAHRAVTCAGELESGDLKGLDKAVWRGGVIDRRFQTLRFEPPRLRGKSVCVRIDRTWLPDTPGRFWGPGKHQ